LSAWTILLFAGMAFTGVMGALTVYRVLTIRFFPTNETEWRAAITYGLLALVLTFEILALARRRSGLFLYVVLVAAAIVAIGWATPILVRGITEAGWNNGGT
jgi:hypothetical protein